MSDSTLTKSSQKMPRTCRRFGFAVSCLVGIAIAAPEASGQLKSAYIDFVVPFTFRDLHPAIVEVMPNCQVRPASPKSGPITKTGSNIIGETRVQNMNKSADGSYSVTLTERVEFDLPTSVTGGTILPYYCTVRGKTMNGSIRDFSQVVPGFAGPETFKLAPGSTDKVNGQFTW